MYSACRDVFQFIIFQIFQMYHSIKLSINYIIIRLVQVL